MLVYGPFAANAITSRRAFVSMDIYKPFSLTEIQNLTMILKESQAKREKRNHEKCPLTLKHLIPQINWVILYQCL